MDSRSYLLERWTILFSKESHKRSTAELIPLVKRAKKEGVVIVDDDLFYVEEFLGGEIPQGFPSSSVGDPLAKVYGSSHYVKSEGIVNLGGKELHNPRIVDFLWKFDRFYYPQLIDDEYLGGE